MSSGYFEVILAATEHHALRQARAATGSDTVGGRDDARNARQRGQAGRGGTDVGRAAVIVHEIQTVLGVVPQPAQRRAPLPGIPGIAVLASGNDHPFAGHLEALAKGGGNRLQGAIAGLATV